METDVNTYLARIFNPVNRDSVIDECLGFAASRLSMEGEGELRRTWQLTSNLYAGTFPGYSACNTEYHDFRHSCDVVCATIRMCDGALFNNINMTSELQLDLCIAAMLHDSGYIQELADTSGTGAKYTKTHVSRSMSFVKKYYDTFGLTLERAERIARLIAGTDLSTPFDSIAFADRTELFAGKLLASADLLGQMADRTYLEKLLFLYYEFKEAGFPGYETEFDMLRKTIGFYEMTKNRIFVLLGEVSDLPLHHFKNRYGVSQNLYIESIERQIAYLQSILDDDSVNFRKKLKRLDLEEISRTHHKFAPDKAV